MTTNKINLTIYKDSNTDCTIYEKVGKKTIIHHLLFDDPTINKLIKKHGDNVEHIICKWGR